MKKFFSICLVTSFLLVGCNRGPSQESNKSSTSEASTTESSERSKGSSSFIYSAASLSGSSSSQLFSSEPASTKQSEVDTVTADEFGGYATFYFNADTNNETVYNFTMQDVPVKSIRIFSAETNEIRTVKVSTMLSIGVQISGATNKNNQSGNLYLFHNKHGRLSLATPNYAGNVSADQSDVMLEVLQ